MRARRAFTLIELITVMAVTAILLTIIVVPVVQSFNLTRAGQGFADAQSKARTLIARVQREVNNAAAVRDNTNLAGMCAVHLPGLDRTDRRLLLPFSKLDIFPPAQGDPGARVGTAFIDPDTGKVDPTLKAPKGQAVLPVGAGDTMVRYFVALRDPFSPYNNPWVTYKNPGGGTWLAGTSGQDNLYVLYRAEVPVYKWVNIGGTPTRVVNSDYFYDLDRDADPNTSGPGYDDPDFMDPSVAYPAYATAMPYDPANKGAMVNNWLRAARIVTEISRYDMVLPEVNKSNGSVLFDASGNPVVSSTARFQPTRVSSEPSKGMLAVRSGEENDNAQKIGPDVYSTEHASWANATVQLWPSRVPTTWGAGDASAGAVRPAADPSVGSLVLRPGVTGSLVLSGVGGFTGDFFDAGAYMRMKSAGAAYPFTKAVMAGASTTPDLFLPVVPDPRSGKVLASFPIQEWGTDESVAWANRVPSSGADPGLDTGPAVTPADAFYKSGPDWYTFTGINERYARLWNQWEGLWPNPAQAPAKEGPFGVKRSIYLGEYPQWGSGNTMGPLSPGFGFHRASVTPGSDEVYGPDQTPGPNYGRLVRYTRVPNVESIPVGPNQYKINYVDRKEPDWAGLFGFGGVNYDPKVMNFTSFLSGVLQERYRAGYIELNSRFGEPIPAGNIFVAYRFQFTEPNDAVAVSYDSSELMEVVLTIHNYPQTTVPYPQIVTVRGTVAVRNAVR
ncbi:MAG: prepilin-type N-terminal cleavage/methylation domain-containing protein [Fimbriimonadaceae bacterium]|nr:prepilin-type N-terminal cleavage/methylation domain-containing protein [Fimbriimonadaceae bacterium]